MSTAPPPVRPVGDAFAGVSIRAVGLDPEGVGAPVHVEVVVVPLVDRPDLSPETRSLGVGLAWAQMPSQPFLLFGPQSTGLLLAELLRHVRPSEST